MQKKTTNYYHNKRSEMLDYLPEEVDVCLEVGCGQGNFSTQVAKKFSAETWGIEPNKEAAAISKKQLDNVINLGIEEALTKLPNNKFDVIVFNDVLEHLYDPYKTLQDIKPKLKKTGCVVASIPNMRYFHVLRDLVLHSGWRYGDSGVLDFTHVRFFTHQTMQDMFEEAGYKIDIIEGINPTNEIPLKFKVLNLLMRNRFWDTPYIQFAVRASKK